LTAPVEALMKLDARRVRALGLAVLFVAGASSAWAQQDMAIDRTRLHVSDPAACAALEKKGLDAFTDMDFLVLDFARGIDGMEFTCRFYDLKTRPGDTSLFVSAICQHPGEMYPDILAAAPYDERRVQVVSSRSLADEAAGLSEPAEEGPPGATLYTRCDSLSELPR
jgi:hypothetical protein